MTHRPAQPRPAAAPAKFGAAKLAAAAAGGLLRFLVRRPIPVLATVAIAGGTSVFAWNATMTQTARHPSPLFAGQKTPKAEPRRTEIAAPATTGATRAEAPVPPPRPANPDAIGSIIRSADAKPAEPKKVAETRPKPVEPKPKPVEAKAPDVKPAADSKPTAQPRVASAQKALAKLGYGPIASDGLMGSATRAALERFERDKNLPVTGDLGPKTMKRLASLSGISVE